MKNIRQFLYLYFPYILIGFVLLHNLGVYYSHSYPSDKLFDSDCNYLPTLYRDLFVNGGNYSDWYGSAAPYYFPDMLVYFFSNFITGNFYHAIPLSFTIFSILILISVYRINRNFFDHIAALYMTVLPVSFFYIFPTYVYSMQFATVFHYGEFIIALLSVGLILAMLRYPWKKTNYVLLICLSILTTASDSMYILHLVLPTLVTLLVLWLVKMVHHKQVFIISASLIISMFMGKILSGIITINQSNYAKAITLSTKHLFVNISRILEIIQLSFNEYPLSSLLILAMYILITYLLLKYVRNPKVEADQPGLDKLLFLFIYLIVTLFGNILALSFIYPNKIYQHYMIPVFLLPIILIPAVLYWTRFHLKSKLFKRSYVTFSFLMAFVLLFQTYTKFNDVSFKNEYYPETVACIDSFIEKTGAKHGISEYWDSKYTHLLSKNDITIAQYTFDLTRFEAVNTIAWYKNYYDFALIKNNSLNKNKILSLNGKPSAVVKCFDTEILYYENKMVINDTLSKAPYQNLPEIQNETIGFNSSDVVFSGWSYNETHHRWSHGKQSLILFRINPDHIEGKLNLHIGTLGVQHIHIRMNDYEIYSNSLNSADKKISIRFKSNILFKEQTNILSFEFPDARLPNTDDKRMLAMLIRSLIIE